VGRTFIFGGDGGHSNRILCSRGMGGSDCRDGSGKGEERERRFGGASDETRSDGAADARLVVGDHSTLRLHHSRTAPDTPVAGGRGTASSDEPERAQRGERAHDSLSLERGGKGVGGVFEGRRNRVKASAQARRGAKARGGDVVWGHH
jgi:hypothetical protein